MRLVLQRVTEARVIVQECTVGSIQIGLVALLGVSRTDTRADADYLLKKVLEVRIFPDDAGRMNRNIQEIGGAILIVSQFTLLADCRRGRRPSFDRAAPPDQALALYNYFVSEAKRSAVPVETGIFQASMKVSLVNDGPVTLVMDSAEATGSRETGK
jgi:D-tyrosyl-tRNA(Tyr) deacylase